MTCDKSHTLRPNGSRLRSVWEFHSGGMELSACWLESTLSDTHTHTHTHTHAHTTDHISPKSDISQNIDRPVPSFEDFVLLGYGVALLDVSTKLSSSEVSGSPPPSWCSRGFRSSETIRRRRVVGLLPIFRENMSHLDP